MSCPITTIGRRYSPDQLRVYYLSLLGFFAIFSATISKNPVLPLFSQALGADDAVIRLIAAFSPLAGIIFSFPVGVLSDHIGRRRLLIISGIVFLSVPILYLLITDPVWLIPIRFFHGTATAILGPVISAIIAERFPENKGAMLAQVLIGYPDRQNRGTLDQRDNHLIFRFFYPGLIQYRIAGTKPFFGKLADRFDKRVQIAAGLIIVGFSVGSLPLLSSFAMFLLVNALLGLGMSLSTVATSAYVADVARKEQIGASMGALSSIMDIGHSAGSLITGIIITAVNYTIGFLASFLLVIVLIAVRDCV